MNKGHRNIIENSYVVVGSLLLVATSAVITAVNVNIAIVLYRASSRETERDREH